MTPDGPNPPPQMLEYSTVATEGPPSWHPQAEAMVYLGNPPEALLEFFESPRDAVRYYAMSMSRRFDVARLDDRCILCGGRATERVVRVGWRARLKLPGVSRWPRLWKTDTVSGFSTLHPICAECYLGWRRRNQVRTMWIIGIAGLAVLGLCVGSVMMMLRGAYPDVAIPGALGMTLAICIFTALALENLAWKRPRQFRQYFPRGVVASGDLELLPRPVAREVKEPSR